MDEIAIRPSIAGRRSHSSIVGQRDELEPGDDLVSDQQAAEHRRGKKIREFGLHLIVDTVTLRLVIVRVGFEGSDAMWRHGDVLIAPVDAMPEGATRQHHCLLAEGELTGHCHRVEGVGVAELYDAGFERFLRVIADSARIVHEEHHPITLPRGIYRVWQQREYTPQAIITVRD